MTRRGAGFGSFVLNCSQVGRRREKWADQLIEKSEDVRNWWARQDLNLGPTDYESAALTAELRAPRVQIVSFYAAFWTFSQDPQICLGTVWGPKLD
jgi:hypothetical protein